MKKMIRPLALLACAAAFTYGMASSGGGTKEATCDVKLDGITDTGSSGKCSIESHPNKIIIHLANGDALQLNASNEGKGKFKDKSGTDVWVGHNNKNGTQSFSWPHKKIVATFGAAATASKPATATPKPN
jgi:hypothetical protein